MRITPLVLALSGCVGLAAACAHAQSGGITEGAAAPLCQLSLTDASYGRELVAEAAPGLSGYWTLEAGGPAMMMQQSGDLLDRPAGARELARLQIAAPTGPAPRLDELRPGQTIVSGSRNDPVFASLRLETADGGLICATELDQDAHSD